MQPTDRLQRQLAFILEIDKLKHVVRRTLLLDGSRRENDAEHSWHFALMAVLLSEYASDQSLDVLRAVKMALVHDLVEIDAGDTYAYDSAGMQDKDDREPRAAKRIFGLLPSEQGAELCALWEEFEAMATPESRYANALDRLQPMLHNYHTGGTSWLEHGVHADQVRGRCAPIHSGAPELGVYIDQLIDDAVDKGYLLP